MENLRTNGKNYFDILKERAKKSRVYKTHQETGLILADLLDDQEHKSLYMKLSKLYNNQELIGLARNLSERRNIKNKGAYFMKILKSLDLSPKK